MIDLTRARYLGLAHPHGALAPWRMLTTGQPAALGDVSRGVADRLACLLGFEAATLAPSTLHVVVDLYAALAGRVRQIFIDACSYPVTQWGLERARLRGVEIIPFTTAGELDDAVTCASAIVCDAVCLACRRVAPLHTLAKLAASRNAWLIVDDSQGVGLLGDAPTYALPYGRGGRGTLQFCGAPCDRVMAIGSLAKAFGAPLAFFAADRATVRWFERTSGTRVHASPCNAAALSALDAALRENAERGDTMRAELAARVSTFRAAAGATLSGGMFPVQSTRPVAADAARGLAERLLHRGVRAVPLRGTSGRGRVGFVISAAHDRRDVERAGTIVREAMACDWRANAA